MTQRYFVGMSIGQASQFTAPAVLQRPDVTVDDPPEKRRPYELRHLKRFALGTSYPDIIQAVRQLLKTPPLPGCMVIVDQTGVGRAVIGLFRDGLFDQVTCTFAPITLTAGLAVAVGETGGILIPKKELVGVLQVLLQTRRLQMARTLPDADTLVRELENFRMKTQPLIDDTLETWREGQNDDLVFAVALAAWCGEQGLPRLDEQPIVPVCFVP